ncbi:hypothetical protein [Sphingomonas sp.]|uniref:hypothetical protein n=1 Tax=Sphingomonas sp. TaxID=28214 RepID=UPI003CC689DF
MTDVRLPAFSTATPRGLRVGLVSVLVLLAFLLGLLVAWAMVRKRMAQDAQAPPLALAAPVPAAASPMPVPVATPVATDPGSLSAREAVLSGQLAALEARTASLAASADAAGGQATRAEALLTALAARRAIDRGQPLGALEPQLQTRFGTVRPNAVRALEQAARQPVTLEDLRQALESIGPAAASSLGDGWWATARRELRTLVVIRRVDTPSPRPADHLARARRLLDAGQVEAARAEVAQLPGADEAAGWLAAARRYTVARLALDTLESAALTMPPPTTAPMPAAAR